MRRLGQRFCAMVPGGGGVATPTTEEEKTTPSSEQQPPPVPPETGPPSLAADSHEGKPWALKLGEYLQRRSKGEVTEPDADAVPWAVQLGTYLREKQPGPWSLLANEKPQDPLVRCRSGACGVSRRSGEPSAHPCPQALRLGNFINETQPIKVFHQGSDDASGEQPKEPKDPLVLRLGNYLSGSKEAPTSAEPPPVEPPPPSAAAEEAVPVPAAAPAPPVPPPATSEPAAATPPAAA